MLVVRHVGARIVRQLVFCSGAAMPLITVGATGTWQVAARDVAPVHLVLGFNGRELYVAAAGPARVFVNGVPLEPRAWSVVAPGVAIDFGDARLRVTRRRLPAAPSRVAETGV